jgi:methenyltetrahydromethanopterin cyclohydrolase
MMPLFISEQSIGNNIKLQKMTKFPTPSEIEDLRAKSRNAEAKAIILECLISGYIEYRGKSFEATEIPWALIKKNCDLPALQEELAAAGWDVQYHEYWGSDDGMIQQICVVAKEHLGLP